MTASDTASKRTGALPTTSASSCTTGWPGRIEPSGWRVNSTTESRCPLSAATTLTRPAAAVKPPAPSATGTGAATIASTSAPAVPAARSTSSSGSTRVSAPCPAAIQVEPADRTTSRSARGSVAVESPSEAERMAEGRGSPTGIASGRNSTGACTGLSSTASTRTISSRPVFATAT